MSDMHGGGDEKEKEKEKETSASDAEREEERIREYLLEDDEAQRIREFLLASDRQPAPTETQNYFVKKRTFTIFCEGTGGHREGRCLELVTELAAAYWSRDAESEWGRGTESYQLDGVPVTIEREGTHADGRPKGPTTNHELYLRKYIKSFLILDGVGLTDMAEYAPDLWLPGAQRGRIDPSGSLAAGDDPAYGKWNPKVELGLLGEGNPDEAALKRRKAANKRTRRSALTGHPMPGDFDFGEPVLDEGAEGAERFRRKLKPNAADRTSHHKFIDPTKNAATLGRAGEILCAGTIIGEGWNDNVTYAIHVLRRLEALGKFPTVINLVGWSRGAVTCIKLANAIHRHFVMQQAHLHPPEGSVPSADTTTVQFEAAPAPAQAHLDLELNIFGVDPVPGLFGGSTGDWMNSSRRNEIFPPGITDICTIPPSVKHCIFTLAMDEQRTTFAPVDAKQIRYYQGPDRRDLKHPEHVITFLPFPGVHRTQVRLEPNDPIPDRNKPPVRHKLGAAPLVVFDLALRFLEAHGTKFAVDYRKARRGCWPGDAPLSLEMTVERYSNMKLNRHGYHQGRNRGTDERGAGGLWRAFRARRFTGRNFSKAGHKKGDKALYLNENHELTVYVRDFKYFQNEHHRAAFERAYPDLYGWLVGTPYAGMKRQQTGDDNHLVLLLRRLKQRFRDTYSTLCLLGLKEIAGGFELPVHGAALQADHGPSKSLRDAFVGDLGVMGVLSWPVVLPAIRDGLRQPVG